MGCSILPEVITNHAGGPQALFIWGHGFPRRATCSTKINQAISTVMVFSLGNQKSRSKRWESRCPVCLLQMNSTNLRSSELRHIPVQLRKLAFQDQYLPNWHPIFRDSDLSSPTWPHSNLDTWTSSFHSQACLSNRMAQNTPRDHYKTSIPRLN